MLVKITEVTKILKGMYLPVVVLEPLRQVRALVREVLKGLGRSFSRPYPHEGRPSIPPEQLLSALLLQVL
jgi:hypothetical protein